MEKDLKQIIKIQRFYKKRYANLYRFNHYDSFYDYLELYQIEFLIKNKNASYDQNDLNVLKKKKQNQILGNYKSKQYLKPIMKIQFFFKLKNQIKKFQQNSSKRQKRYQAFEELLSTEKNYFNFIQKIVRQFIPRIQNLITVNESQQMFQLFQPLYSFHEDFLKYLTQKFENYKHEAKFFDNFTQQMNYFKIYFLYSAKYFKVNQQFLLNKQLYQIAKDQFDFQDMFYMPVQRLPQYVMLMKQIQKYTDQDHQDFKNIQEVLHFFEEINYQNNKKMEDEEKKEIILQYQYKFPNLEVLVNDRIFIMENEMFYINATKAEKMSCLFFNNCLIIHQNYTNEKILNFDKFSFIRSLVSKKYFKNLFIIYGKQGGFVFSMESKKQLIKNLQNKLKFQKSTVQVETTGSVKRPEKDNLGTYDKYIVQIEKDDKFQRIILRYKQVEQIEAKLKQYKIEHKQAQKQHVSSSTTKLIESRKLQIQSLIQHILIQENIQPILEYLNINIFQESQVREYQFLKGENLSYFLYKLRNQQIQRIQYKIESQPKSTIAVQLYSFNNDCIPIGVDQTYRVQNLLDKAVNILKIKYYEDMEILIQQKQNSYYLDLDEYIVDLKNLTKQRLSLSNLTKDFLNSNSTFILKKTIFLPLNYEINEYIHNYQKLNFVVNQVLKDLDIYQIEDEKLQIIQCLYLYSEYGQDQSISDKTILNLIQQFNSQINKHDQQNYIASLKIGWQQIIYEIDQIDQIDQIKEIEFQPEQLQQSLIQVDLSNKNRNAFQFSAQDIQLQIQQQQKSLIMNKQMKQKLDQETYYQSQQLPQQNQNQSYLKQSVDLQQNNEKNKSILKSTFNSILGKKQTDFVDRIVKLKFDFQLYFKQYLDKINNIQKDIQDNNNNKKSSFFEQKQSTLHSQKKQMITKLAILQILEESFIYGANIFQAETYKKNMKDEDYQGNQLYYTDLPDQIILSIKYQGIWILDQKHQFQTKIIYNDIIDCYYEPKSINIECYFTNNQMKLVIKRFRFDTVDNYDIYSKIKLYCNLTDIRQGKNISDSNGWYHQN